MDMNEDYIVFEYYGSDVSFVIYMATEMGYLSHSLTATAVVHVRGESAHTHIEKNVNLDLAAYVRGHLSIEATVKINAIELIKHTLRAIVDALPPEHTPKAFPLYKLDNEIMRISLHDPVKRYEPSCI